MANILPLLSSLAKVSGPSSPSPETGSAPLLLSWMRLRNALRSPGLAFLTGTIGALRFFDALLCFCGMSFRLRAAGTAASAALEEKGALGSVTGWIRDATGQDGLIRLRRRLAVAMVGFEGGFLGPAAPEMVW